MRCEICHENLRRDQWRLHHQTVHADYAQWFRGWSRRFYVIVAGLLPILIILYYLMQIYGGLYITVGGVFILAFSVGVSTRFSCFSVLVRGSLVNGGRIIQDLNSLLVRLSS